MAHKPPFEALVDAYGKEIFGYLWRMLYDTHDAEDCLQETYLKAFRAYKRTKPDSNYRAWLYKIATNTARTFAEKRKKVGTSQLSLADTHIISTNSFSEQLGQKELISEVLTAVNALPNKQRAALMMRKYQEFEYHEIAEVIGGTEESARANVYQALRKLRKKFPEEGRK